MTNDASHVEHWLARALVTMRDGLQQCGWLDYVPWISVAHPWLAVYFKDEKATRVAPVLLNGHNMGALQQHLRNMHACMFCRTERWIKVRDLYTCMHTHTHTLLLTHTLTNADIHTCAHAHKHTRTTHTRAVCIQRRPFHTNCGAAGGGRGPSVRTA
jgi:hypothetical protein